MNILYKKCFFMGKISFFLEDRCLHIIFVNKILIEDMKKSILTKIFILSLILSLSSCSVWWETPYDPSYYNDPLMPPPVVNPMPPAPQPPHNPGHHPENKPGHKPDGGSHKPDNKPGHKPDGGNHKPDNKPNVKPNTPDNKPGISSGSRPGANSGVRPGGGTRSGNRRH